MLDEWYLIKFGIQDHYRNVMLELNFGK